MPTHGDDSHAWGRCPSLGPVPTSLSLSPHNKHSPFCLYHWRLIIIICIIMFIIITIRIKLIIIVIIIIVITHSQG